MSGSDGLRTHLGGKVSCAQVIVSILTLRFFLVYMCVFCTMSILFRAEHVLCFFDILVMCVTCVDNADTCICMFLHSLLFANDI